MNNTSQNPEFLDSFLDYSITILNKSPNSIKEYNYDLNCFLKFIKQRFKMTDEKDFSKIDITDITIEDIKKITLEDIHAYISHMAKDLNSKPATRARKISTIRIFFRYLTQKANLIKINPAMNLETPKIGKRIPKYLSLEESQRLLYTVSKKDELNNDTNKKNRNQSRDYAIITLFLNCGLRLSELVGINIPNIDFSECKLNVIGKGNKERTVYLNKACMNAINNYLLERPKQGIKINSKNALFLSERKERISNRAVQTIVQKELNIAGLGGKQLSVHKLRHTAATLMYQYGQVDIRALQVLLGHESISTTEIYTHVENYQVRNAVENNPLSNFNTKTL